MTPVSEDEAETHELFNTLAAKAYVEHEQHLKDVRRSPATAPAESSAAS
jgi:hypothetical protein